MVAGACGGSGGHQAARSPGAARSAVTRSATPAAARKPIPPGLRIVESASEDTIDDALAGRRAAVVRKARRLQAAAAGPVARELRAAGVPAATIADFRARAERVARLATKADLLQVALASNHAFESIAGFYALYRSRIPAPVSRLDYLDYEAKLQAKAGNATALRTATAGLAATWRQLRPGFIQAGGARVAPRFDAHVARMRRLAAVDDRAQAIREAQRGLDLVDVLEHVYERRA
jgi:hypothetical protein